MSTPAPIALLAWDTEFFGLRVARVTTPALDRAAADAVRAWCTAEQIAIATFLAEADDVASAEAVQAVGFRDVDTRMTLRAEAEAFAGAAAAPDIRLFRPEDLEPLQAIAQVSHTDSRFYADARFPRERADALYARWIARDADPAERARRVWVAEHAGEAAGYCTTWLDGDAAPAWGEIGLLAVGDRAQGRGLGRRLIEAACTDLVARGAAYITVVTQGRNTGAQAVYGRCGFAPMRAQTWWHG